jgi:hypothetical protein
MLDEKVCGSKITEFAFYLGLSLKKLKRKKLLLFPIIMFI